MCDETSSQVLAPKGQGGGLFRPWLSEEPRQSSSSVLMESQVKFRPIQEEEFDSEVSRFSGNSSPRDDSCSPPTITDSSLASLSNFVHGEILRPKPTVKKDTGKVKKRAPKGAQRSAFSPYPGSAFSGRPGPSMPSTSTAIVTPSYQFVPVPQFSPGHLDVARAAQLIHQQDVVARQMKKNRPKKFQCDHCPIAFSNNGQLTGHRRIHTGERPFKCAYEGCEKAFTRNEELTRHKRIHTGVRPHVCIVCGKPFGRKDHLKKHMRTHEARGVASYQIASTLSAPFGHFLLAPPPPLSLAHLSLLSPPYSDSPYRM